MSRPRGTVPAAFSATGQEVPPSPDVARHDAAQLFGQSVAFHVAQLLGPVLQRLVDVQERPACVICAKKAKSIAIANARAAAEDEAELKMPPINQSFTAGARGMVCWSCFDPDAD